MCVCVYHVRAGAHALCLLFVRLFNTLKSSYVHSVGIIIILVFHGHRHGLEEIILLALAMIRSRSRPRWLGPSPRSTDYIIFSDIHHIVRHMFDVRYYIEVIWYYYAHVQIRHHMGSIPFCQFHSFYFLPEKVPRISTLSSLYSELGLSWMKYFWIKKLNGKLISGFNFL